MDNINFELLRLQMMDVTENTMYRSYTVIRGTPSDCTSTNSCSEIINNLNISIHKKVEIAIYHNTI